MYTQKNSWAVALLALLTVGANALRAQSQIAVKGELVHTSAGKPITRGIVLIKDGKITRVGSQTQISVPSGWKTIEAKVVTPGLIDAHSTVGLSGILNVEADQDQLEHSSPIQPELRALDAYNAHEELVDWVRGFGVTTIHTGHAPGELISGQTLVVKTVGNTVEESMLVETCAVAVTLAGSARKSGKESPGTRGKMVSMLRTQLIKASEYRKKTLKSEQDDESEPPARDLKLETLSRVLAGELPLMITVQKAQDIATALRLAKEFEIRVWLDGGAEAYLLLDEIKAAGVPLFVHPTMARPVGDLENMSFETAGKCYAAGIPIAMQAGYEAYVPKTRVVLFEAGMAAAHGLPTEAALQAITISPAKILGIEKRVGSIEVGKDGDLALFDGDPFEYTTHCIGTIVDGVIYEGKR
ncbi:MAG: amidohydrolase family protein [Aureliella sp.]